MSNYSKTTDFAAKDSLPSGDSGKIIRGSEFETEFDAISTAIATKADAADPTFTGTVTIDGLTVNGNTVLGNAATDTVTVTADIASNLIPSADDTYNLGASGAEWNDLYVDGVAYIDTIDGFATTGNVTFGDNDKAIFGAGSDLQIFHDGSNSYISDSGTGDLQIKGTNLYLKGANNETFMYAVENGPVRLYHDNSQKLITTSTGVDVTGTVSADGLSVNSGATNQGAYFVSTDSGQTIALSDSASSNLLITDSNGFNILTNGDANSAGTNATRAARFKPNKDVEFYEDTGTTAKFFWDASAESLGIGTTSPSSALDVQDNASSVISGTNEALLRVRNTAFNEATIGSTYVGHTQGGDTLIANTRATDGVGNIKFYTKTSGGVQERMTVESGGNVGIGTSSPATELHVYNGSSNADIRAQGGGASDYISLFHGASQSGLWSTSSADPMVFATNNDEKMRIDSAGNVGIGTQTVTNSTGYQRTSINGSNGGILEIKSSDTPVARFLATGGSAQLSTLTAIPLLFNTDGLERMRIHANGNVGIGTSSPSADLQVHATSAPRLWITSDGNNPSDAGALRFAEQQNGGAYFEFLHNGSANTLALTSSNGDIALFDRDTRDVFIGKSALNLAATGIELRNSGLIAGTVASDYVARFNRTTNDGEIVQFRKDNSEVGSIGSKDGDLFIHTGTTGLRFVDASNSIRPVTSNGNIRDNAIDLGGTTSRWKDLYLSGGISFNPNAAANKLDDYEEGTWTPVYSTTGTDFTTMTMDVSAATYTKIGNTVFLRGYIRTDDVDNTGATGSVTITGLPFAAAESSAVSVTYVQGWNTGGHPSGGYVSSSVIYLQERATSDGATGGLPVASVKNGTVANQNNVVLLAVYKTTA